MSKLLHPRTARKEVSKLLFQHVTILTALQRAMKWSSTKCTFAEDQAVLFLMRKKFYGLLDLVTSLTGICGKGRRRGKLSSKVFVRSFAKMLGSISMRILTTRTNTSGMLHPVCRKSWMVQVWSLFKLTWMGSWHLIQKL